MGKYKCNREIFNITEANNSSFLDVISNFLVTVLSVLIYNYLFLNTYIILKNVSNNSFRRFLYTV